MKIVRYVLQVRTERNVWKQVKRTTRLKRLRAELADLPDTYRIRRITTIRETVKPHEVK